MATQLLRKKNSNQVSLFGEAGGAGTPKPKLPDIEDWRGTERLGKEFEAVGMYLGSHPLTAYEKILDKMKVVPSGDFSSKIAGGSSKVKIAGVMVSKRIRSSPKGRFATLSLSDPTGLFEVSIFNEDTLEASRDLLENGTLLFIEADARKDDGGVRIIAEKLISLDEAMKNYTMSIKVFLSNADAVNALKSTLGNSGKGKSRVSVILESGSKRVEVTLPDPYSVTVETIAKIKDIDGVISVREQ